MIQRYSAIWLGGILLLAGFVFLFGSGLPSTHTPASPAPFALELKSSALDLQCDIKVANGLAQCGSQASSCKNCHEVKGEDPVNAEGDWHVQHAFGDFCEFCHGGNVQAPEKDAAHQGLIAPLGDVKTNCSSCHADYQTLAAPYASALGMTIGASNGGPTQPPASDSGSTEPAPTPAPDTQGGASAGDEIVDYVAQYPSSGVAAITTGNLVVGVLLVATVLGGGAFIYGNEKRLGNFRLRISERRLKTTPIPAQSEVAVLTSQLPDGFSPELAQLLPMLRSLDPYTLRALKIILSDRKRGEELLQSLSLVNLAVLDEMKRLDKRELSLLLALAAEG
jgi:hypothetical protein